MHTEGPQTAFFSREGDFYRASEYTRGPWNMEHQHGSPATALVGHILQAQSKMQMARLSVEILRAIPIDALEIRTSLLRPGRLVEIRGASVYRRGKELLRASALFIKPEDVDFGDAPELGESQPAAPDQSRARAFPFFLAEKGFHSAVELRTAHGDIGSGRAAVWMRMKVPLIAGEEPTPLDRLLITADCGNGIAAFLDMKKFTFVNPDLTIYMNRLPRGEWVCLDARTRAEYQGIAFSDTAVFDEAGQLGRVNQALLLRHAR